MKKKVLIIYDYERIIPPFLQTLIKIWLDKFDEIKYITPPMPEHYNRILDNDKISIITWNKWQRIEQTIKGVASVFRPRFWNEVFKGRVTKSAIANIGKFYFCSDGFIRLSERFVKSNVKEGNNVFILATWFSPAAFTAARMKDKYPQAKAFALAHSGEVMKERNPLMHQSFHEYIMEKIDRTFFISRNVLRDYLRDMADINIEKRFGSKLTPIYLGCLKTTDSMNPAERTDSIELMSCSRIDANKRLSKIISTLSKWNGPKIRWTHIGTGEMESEIMARARDLQKSNSQVEVFFTGRLDNSKVIDYYAKNHIDLFINVSKSEGLPISIMEAMSYGIPCIATNVGGTAEIVNSSNGYLLNRDFSDDDLLTILDKFSMLDVCQRQSLKENAYKTWSEKFNAEINGIEMYNYMKNS